MKVNKIFQGQKIYTWMRDLFPFHRSITGKGLRKTLYYIKNEFPKMKIQRIRSGCKVFDWRVPKEWNIKEAYISDLRGKKIIDYKKNNLQVVGYSTAVNKILNYEDLQKHLFSLPKQPSAVPYLTSYYKKMWGFCLSENQRKKINKKKRYKVFIDAVHFDGELNYGEIYLKGKSKKEIFISTNVCHPSLANNELSGPVIALAISKHLEKLNRQFSYRIIFVPETIGALVFLKRNKRKLKRIKAGFVLSCIGDDKNYSIINSRYADTYADKVAEFNFKYNKIKFKKYSFLSRGSDERQYCSPKFDLPVCSILRTRYGDYPEYHTSLDNLKLVSPKGLENSYKIMKSLITIIESNKKFKATKYGEPFLHKYNLKQEMSSYTGFNRIKDETKTIIDFLAYSDGKNDLINISKILKKDFFKLVSISQRLVDLKLVKEAK